LGQVAVAGHDRLGQGDVLGQVDPAALPHLR
jgi:hypothetical protein